MNAPPPSLPGFSSRCGRRCVCGITASALPAVEGVNDRQKLRLFEKIDTYFQGDLQGKTFAVWGLAFKPNTDDMREASSRTLMEKLWAAGATVQAFDPVAMDETRTSTATATISCSATIPEPPAKGLTRWRSSPSGTSSAARRLG